MLKIFACPDTFHHCGWKVERCFGQQRQIQRPETSRANQRAASHPIKIFACPCHWRRLAPPKRVRSKSDSGTTTDGTGLALWVPDEDHCQDPSQCHPPSGDGMCGDCAWTHVAPARRGAAASGSDWSWAPCPPPLVARFCLGKSDLSWNRLPASRPPNRPEEAGSGQHLISGNRLGRPGGSRISSPDMYCIQ